MNFYLNSIKPTPEPPVWSIFSACRGHVMGLCSPQICVLLLLFAMQPPTFGALAIQTGRQRIPVGHSDANQATRDSENVEAPAPARPTVTKAQVMQQADELLSLAQEVHKGAEQATQGLLDHKMKEKLKRVEKLSKKLRDELGL